MSGVGKSHFARKLATERAFRWHDCDSRIADRVGGILQPGEDEHIVLAVGRWMGNPWGPDYDAREARYLAIEEEVTREALDAVRGKGPEQVIDTTGSVVYLAQPVLDAVRARTRVVYLRTPPAARAAMLRRYREEPKPVVWGGLFEPRKNEAPEDALPRCYGELLDWRDTRYAALAHAILDGSELDDTSGVDKILHAAWG